MDFRARSINMQSYYKIQVENHFSAKGHLETCNIIHRPYEIINLKTGLLQFYLESCMWLPWQGQIKLFHRHYIAYGPDVPHSCYKKRL